MKKIKTVISLGDLYDRISILNVKLTMIPDQDAINNVAKELSELMGALSKSDHIFDVEHMKQLQIINRTLWDLETNVRRKLTDKEFICTAKEIFAMNDKRAEVKRTINLWNKSNIVEEKYHSE